MAINPTYSQEYLDSLPLWLKEAMNLSDPNVRTPIQQEDNSISPFVYTRPNIGLFDQVNDDNINLGIDQEDLFNIDTKDTFGIGKGLENALNSGFGIKSFDKDDHQDDKNVAHVHNLGNLAQIGIGPGFLAAPLGLSLAVQGLFNAFDIAASNKANPHYDPISYWNMLNPFFDSEEYVANQKAARLGFTEESNPEISGRGMFFKGMHPVEKDYRYSIDPDSAVVRGLVSNPFGTNPENANNPNSPTYSIDHFDIIDINNPIDGFYNDGGDDSGGFGSSADPSEGSDNGIP